MPTPAENHDLTGCFACGTANPEGIGLRFRLLEGGGVAAEVVTSPAWVSWRGLTHGGLLITMMDEAMGWAVAAGGHTGLTGRLEARLHAPVAPGTRLHVRGWVREWKKRLAYAAAEIRDDGGRLLAASEATLAIAETLPV
jgi:acyl-coenzyme A thioesterase PaaI-like protein